jgi:hypothetical protein
MRARRHTPLLGLTALLCVLGGGSAAVAAEDAGAVDVTAAAVAHGATTGDAARAGIWKAVMPPSGSMHGEFDNNDPLGLAAGARIPADCSLNWVDPDFHKLYCFSTATSLVYFLDSPRAFLARARKNWAALGHSG